jgi:hypothetical protein
MCLVLISLFLLFFAIILLPLMVTLFDNILPDIIQTILGVIGCSCVLIAVILLFVEIYLKLK